MKYKYRAWIIDRMQTMDTHKTKWFPSYKQAYDAAMRIDKKYFGESQRAAVSIETEEDK